MHSCQIFCRKNTMPRNFGEILEEARTRQGISIREAADATKIRGDFLQAFESNGGDIPMPEVYRRGFLRLYAEFLKLDQQQIQEAYIQYHEGSSRHARKQGRETLGRVDVPSEKASKSSSAHFSQATLPLANPSREIDSRKEEPEGEEEEEESLRFLDLIKWEENKAKYIKTGGIIAASLVAILGVVFLVSKAGNPSATDFNPELSTVASNTANTAEAMPRPEEISLIGNGEVHVVVRQEIDKKRLYSGTLDAGKKISLQRQGPVKIHFSNGTNLTIETASGEKVRPAREGIGWIEIQDTAQPIAKR